MGLKRDPDFSVLKIQTYCSNVEDGTCENRFVRLKLSAVGAERDVAVQLSLKEKSQVLAQSTVRNAHRRAV